MMIIQVDSHTIQNTDTGAKFTFPEPIVVIKKAANDKLVMVETATSIKPYINFSLNFMEIETLMRRYAPYKFITTFEDKLE